MATELQSSTALYNVQSFGATGKKDQDAQAAIQKAIDTCAAAGGGIVYFPPGAYTSGTIHLRSHVRVYIEAGATVYSSKELSSYDKHGLFYAEDVENISLEGRGTVDGQGEYEWRLMDMRDWYIYPNQVLMEKANLPLMRSFPTKNSYGNLVLFVRCTDVRISGLSFLHSPSWTMHIWGCERLVIDGVYVYTSQEAGVWADGIDPDCCKDVHISNCTIETGDDALVFYCSESFGPARPCENITVTNCRLSSSSSALKFCDGNVKAIRNVTIDNCVITNSNRGVAFMVFDGGILENVVMTNLTIDCRRFDWFWWGEGDPIHFNLIKRSEMDPNTDKSKERPTGIIRNVILRNIIARGEGSCQIHGSADSPLENIAIENVKLVMSNNPSSPLQKSVNAIDLDNARNLRMKDIDVAWSEPYSEKWRSALVAEKVEGLTLDAFTARQAPVNQDAPVVVLKDAHDAVIKNCQAKEGTVTFLQVAGESTTGVVLSGNDGRAARKLVECGGEVKKDAVQQGWSGNP